MTTSAMGRPKDCFFDQSNNGTAYVKVPFEVKSKDGSLKQVNWTGWLTVKAMENTINNLLKLGMKRNGFKSLTDGAKGSDVLDTTKEIEVTLTHQLDQNGKVRLDEAKKPYWEVRFIGPAQKVSNKDTMAKLKQLNFESRFRDAYDKLKGTPTTPSSDDLFSSGEPPAAKYTTDDLATEAVPF